MRRTVFAGFLTLMLLAGLADVAASLDPASSGNGAAPAPSGNATPPAPSPAVPPVPSGNVTPPPAPSLGSGASAESGASGTQTWFLENGAGCGGGADHLKMVRGGGQGTGDVHMAEGERFTFCANEAAIANVSMTGHFITALVFREPHPFVNGTDQTHVDLLCKGIPTDDQFTLWVGVWHTANQTFEPRASLEDVRACELYKLPVEVNLSEPAAFATLPLWTTTNVSFPLATVKVLKGEYLAMQVEKNLSALPVHLAANLVTTAPASLIPGTDSPSIFVSPPTDPGYPVPELSTLLLSVAGLAAVGLVMTRRS